MVDAPSPVSLYIHIPFCKKKCGYCHFYVIPDKEPFKRALMQGLEKEWQQRVPLLEGKEVISVYFGGGTPSLLEPSRIEEILSWMAPYFSKTPPEITLEANPEFITAPLMAAFKKGGINRLSMGVQSLDEALLKRLTRAHDGEMVRRALSLAVDAGIDNLSIDLMYDIPGQTLSSWQETLARAAKLPITHLSLYNLTIEPHTSFFKRRAAIEADLPSEEESAKMVEAALSRLSEAGLHPYEISAFAKEGKRSVHNTGYWTGRPFLGFGPSAFSYWDNKRFRNIANLNRYCRLLEEGALPVDFEEQLEEIPARRELFVIHLRLLEGVNLPLFEERHGPLDQEMQEALKELVNDNFIKIIDSHYRLTEKGVLFYDSVASHLI